jgi:hypothetical protein
MKYQEEESELEIAQEIPRIGENHENTNREMK